MYRQYEDPYELEDKLAELKAIYRRGIEEGIDEDVLMNLSMDINELEERVNFAWQDNEYEEEYNNENN
jgi:hypothetical protein